MRFIIRDGRRKGMLAVFWLWIGTFAVVAAPDGAPEPLGPGTLSLAKLRNLLTEHGRSIETFCTEGLVCAVDHQRNLLACQDDSAALMLEVPLLDAGIQPGDWVRVTGDQCALTRSQFGIKLGTAPVVNNDGHHPALPNSGKVFLAAGQQPIRVTWFNGRNARTFFGWENLANVPGNPYPGGEVVLIPTGGGAMDFGGSDSYDASFDVGLSAVTTIAVNPPVVAPQAAVTAGTAVTISTAPAVIAPFSGTYAMLLENMADAMIPFVDGTPVPAANIAANSFTVTLGAGSHTVAIFTSHYGRNKLVGYLGPISPMSIKGLSGAAFLFGHPVSAPPAEQLESHYDQWHGGRIGASGRQRSRLEALHGGHRCFWKTGGLRLVSDGARDHSRGQGRDHPLQQCG
jgi:hypothetical protein